MSSNAKAVVAFLLALGALAVVYVVAQGRISGAGLASPTPIATTTTTAPSPLPENRASDDPVPTAAEFGVEDPAGTVLRSATDSVDFLSAVGTTTVPKTFIVSNTGDLSIEDIAVTVSGAAADDFEISPLPTAMLTSGDDTALSISFTPKIEGEHRATLKIESSTTETFEVMLIGEGATVWSGPVITFANTCALCSSDQITPTIAITRGESSGIFNAAAETKSAGKQGPSPIDTEWAYGTTSDMSELDFRPWFEWLGFSSPSDSVDQDAVLHLITDDIYIDIRFTSWIDGQGSGGFSYTRTTPSD